MNIKNEAVKIDAVCVGGKFCDCGGMMEVDKNSGLLLSNPPKVKVNCPFCGEVDYVASPYNVHISFKKSV